MNENNENLTINANSPNHEIRSYLIDKTLEAIEYMSNKAYNGRIRDEEHEKIKINQLKLIINACNVGNRVLKDRQLDDFERDLNALKHGLILEAKSNQDMIEISSEDINEIEALDDKLLNLKGGDEQ